MQSTHDPGLIESVRTARKARLRRETENAKHSDAIANIDDELVELRRMVRAANGELRQDIRNVESRVRHMREDIASAEEGLRQLKMRQDARSAQLHSQNLQYEIPAADLARKKDLEGQIASARQRIETAHRRIEPDLAACDKVDAEINAAFRTAHEAYLESSRRGDLSVTKAPKMEDFRKVKETQLTALVRDAERRRNEVSSRLASAPAEGDEEIAAIGDWLRTKLESPALPLLAMFEDWCGRSGTYFLAGARYVAPSRTITISLGNAARSSWIDSVLAAASKTDAKEAA